METKAVILSKVEETLTGWFQNGVTYAKSGLWYELFKVPVYNNLPHEVERALLYEQRQIILDILKQKRIPTRAWLGCLYSSPINPGRVSLPVLPPLLGFGTAYVPPPIVPIYNTEGLPPGERAQRITKAWHHLTKELWAHFIAQNAKESVRTFIGINLDKEIDKELRLRQAGFTDEDLLIRYARMEGFNSREIADLLSRGLDIPSTPGQIRTRLSRLRQKELKSL